MSRIPFNRPSHVGPESEYVQDAITRRKLAGDGYYTKKATAWFQEHWGVAQCLLTTSCTHAMELAALLYDLKPGDEVVLPSFTFVSTVNAFLLRGVTPVFVDIEPNTLNIDVSQLEQHITEKTRLIVPVHYGGTSCDMTRLMEIAKRRGVEVFEDAAQAIDGEWNGQKLGTFGSMSALSFHETKNIICGEGGALLINDPAFVQRAEIIREKGTNRSQFMRGMVQKYTWMDIGSSYLPSDMLAAYLVAQLENMEQIQSRRGEIFTRYYEGLRPLQESGKLTLPVFSTSSKINYHMFYFWVESRDVRDELIDFMRERDIQLVFHYQPLHVSPMGMKLGGKEGTLPVTEDIPHRLLRLPFFYDLTLEEQQRVLSGLFEFFGEEFSK